MGTQIVPGEADVIPPTVIVYRKVDEPFARAVRYAVCDEPRLEHSVAAVSGNIVDAVHREMQIPR